MSRYRCYNCKPARMVPGAYPEFDADRPLCPKCGAGSPAVQELVAVHFLHADPKGPVEGGSGLRFRVACDPKREVLATHNQDVYSATGDPRAVTCPSCAGTEAFKIAAGQIRDLRHAMIQGPPGCCE